jgi:hypothetical protein
MTFSPAMDALGMVKSLELRLTLIFSEKDCNWQVLSTPLLSVPLSQDARLRI